MDNLIEKYCETIKPLSRGVVGREDLIDVMKSTLARPELSNICLLAQAGVGKALTNDTLIYTDRGVIPIGNVCLGDRIYNHKGELVDVVGIYPQGEKIVNKVYFEDGSYLKCCDEHLFTIYKDNKAQVVNVKDIKTMLDVNDKLLVDDVHKPITFGDKGSKFLVYNSNFPFYTFGIYLSYQDFSKNASTFEAFNKGYFTFVKKDIDIDYLKDVILPRMCVELSELLEIKVLYHLDFETEENKVTIRFVNEENRPIKLLNEYIECDKMHILMFSKYAKDMFDAVYDMFMLNVDVIDIDSFSYKYLTMYGYRRINGQIVNRNINHIVKVETLSEKAYMTCITVDSYDELFLAGDWFNTTHNTTLVKTLAQEDDKRVYKEINISKMISDCKDPNVELPAKLELLFTQLSEENIKNGTETVAFIDEFHKLMMLSDMVVESLKPLLADSGTRKIRFICATTYEEFIKYVAPNQALVERLERINVPELSQEATVLALEKMAERYGVKDKIPHDVYVAIYNYTNKFLPSSAQPRKSIKILDRMIGYVNTHSDARFDINLLELVFKQYENIAIRINVDAENIEEELNKSVLAQEQAMATIAERLSLAVAGFSEDNKPMSTFLFTGSTGVGKTATAKKLAELLFGDVRALSRLDMSEYSQASNVEYLREKLCDVVFERPYSVLLLDEIEKAHPDATRLLLQVLDDGRLNDKYGREASFKNAYIILTTNAGAGLFEELQKSNSDLRNVGTKLREITDKDERSQIIRNFTQEYEEEIHRALLNDNSFPKELLGRINCIVPYISINRDTKKRILKIHMNEIIDKVKKMHNISLCFPEREFNSTNGSINESPVVQYIVEDVVGNNDKGGVREILNKFDNLVLSKIAKAINNVNKSNEYTLNKTLYVSVAGTLAIENKLSRESKATVIATFDKREFDEKCSSDTLVDNTSYNYSNEYDF